MKSEEQYPSLDRLRGKDEIKILFVCLGNICRSPAADGIMQDIVRRGAENGSNVTDGKPSIYVDSAGTGRYHIGDLPDSRMRAHAARRGYNLTHICRQVRPADFEEFDLIIPMDASNEENLRRMAPTVESECKIIPMACFVDPAMGYDYIPDPYYEGAEGFERVLDLLENGCQRLYNIIIK